MKLKITLLITCFIISTQAFSQFDSICEVLPGQKINDIATKGNTMFAAMGTDGVYKSTDQGYTWSPCTALPDAYSGPETAQSLLIASNGDLFVGGNSEFSFTGPPLSVSGVVFRSKDDGTTWTFNLIPEMTGTAYAGQIIELSGGKLWMLAGFQEFFTLTLTDTLWTKTTTLGGQITGFMHVDDTVIASNFGINSGLWYSSNYVSLG